MGKPLKYMLISLALNIVTIFLYITITNMTSRPHGDALAFLLYGFVFLALSLLLQTAVALSFLNKEKKRHIGQGMLLAVGIVALIGLSICTFR
jgi:hypothetical protein